MSEPRIYRASSLGYSLEQLVAPHLGYDAIPPPEWLQKAYDEGNEIEPQCIEKLEAAGWKIDASQLEVNLEIIPGKVIVQGHLDGIMSLAGSTETVLEVKSMNPKTWKLVLDKGWDAGGIMEKYKWQASAYALATGLPLTLVAWNKENGDILFLDVSEPFYSISDIANKLQASEDAINSGIIPEGCTDYPCPYFYLHAPIEAPEPAPKELDGLLDAWKEINRKKKIYADEESSLRDMIKEYVGEIAGKVRGSQGITVSTNWVAEKEVSYTKPGHWETRITTPREKKDAT